MNVSSLLLSTENIYGKMPCEWGTHPLHHVFLMYIFIYTLRTQGAVNKTFHYKVFGSEIIWRLQVQSQQQLRITRNTYYNLTLVPSHG